MASPQEVGARRVARFGAFEADLQTAELRKYGIRIKVAEQPFRVLELLLERPGELVTREELQQHLWPGDTYVEFDRSLNAAVKKLRASLGDSPRNPRFIETLPKRGYRFVAAIEEPSEEVPQPQIAEPARSSQPTGVAAPPPDEPQGAFVEPAPSPQRGRQAALAGSLAGLVAVAFFILLWVTTPPYGGSSVEAGPVRLSVRPLAAPPGRVSNPALSPDGKSIAFSWNGGDDSAEPDDWDIYIQEIDGGTPVRVTNAPGRAGTPSWSPDGRFLAFTRDGPAPGGYVVSLRDGSETRMMHYTYGPPSWTPDGKWLVASEDGARIWAVSMQTRERRELTAETLERFDSYATVSPNGEIVAFARCRGYPSCDIYVKPMQDGEARRLTFDRGRIRGLAWTPDSRQIVYSLDGRLYRVPADGHSGPAAIEFFSRELLLGRMSFPTLAPLGPNGPTRMLFTYLTRDIDVWVTDISGDSAAGTAGNRRKLIDSPGEDRWAEFSPDGRHIAFVSTRNGSNGALWVAESDGFHPRQLTPAVYRLQGFGPPAWSHDGTRIAFRASTPSDTAYHIYTIPAEGGTPRRVTSGEDESTPAWSRDGLYIYFFSKRSGRPEIWKAPTKHVGPPLPVSETLSWSYAESPDGRFVYFCGVEKPGMPYGSLFRVPVEGGLREKLLQTCGFYTLHFRGDRLYFLGEGPNDSPVPVNVLDPQTGQITKVGTVQDPMGPRHFSLSPDGRLVLTSNVASLKVTPMLVENFR